MNRMRERVRFNKGLFAWMGFRSIGVPFTCRRAPSGSSRWRPRQLLRFALDGIASFTTIPLRVWSYLGLVISLFAFGYAIMVLVKTLMFGADVPGFPTLIISVMFFAGVQLISLGVIGEYLGRMYEEVKGRPLFLVAEELGIDRAADKPTADGARPTAGRAAQQDRAASMIILCADDYALTEGVSRAIGELAAARRLSATSVHGDVARTGRRRRRACSVHRGHLAIGLHLNLTLGAPLGPMPRLAPGRQLPGRNAPHRPRAAGRYSTPTRSAARSSASSTRFEKGMRLSARPHRRAPARARAAGRPHGRCCETVRAAIRAGEPLVRDPVRRLGRHSRTRGLAAKAAAVARSGAGLRRAAARGSALPTNDGFCRLLQLRRRASPTPRSWRSALSQPGPRHIVMCHPGHPDAELAGLDPVVERRRMEYDALMRDVTLPRAHLAARAQRRRRRRWTGRGMQDRRA